MSLNKTITQTAIGLSQINNSIGTGIASYSELTDQELAAFEEIINQCYALCNDLKHDREKFIEKQLERLQKNHLNKQ